MVWSPNHGGTAFTVPLFDEFMRRIMPGNDWRSGQNSVIFIAYSESAPTAALPQNRRQFNDN
jgi:hypothetical protein